jgi:hypothetical protein
MVAVVKRAMYGPNRHILPALITSTPDLHPQLSFPSKCYR